VEIYDPLSHGSQRYHGDDTFTKITILDEDFPGTLGFAMTDIQVSKWNNSVSVSIVRTNGSDGPISCFIRTEKYTDDPKLEYQNAKDYDDYTPKHEEVKFDAGENEKTIKIDLLASEDKGDQT